MGSDASDMFHVSALPEEERSWCTEQDRDLSRVERLAKHLRERPLLPLDPQDPEKVWSDTRSGVCLPLAHCAFRGCTWTLQKLVKAPSGLISSHVSLLNDHLLLKHREQFREACGKEVKMHE